MIYCRQQEEREIRHKLKKGELDDIPRDVLDSFPTLLSAPAKGKCMYLALDFGKAKNLYFLVSREGIQKMFIMYSYNLEEPYSYGSYDTGDPNTTNLYIGNISPEVCTLQ